MIFRLGAMFFTACIALAACSDEMTEENGFRENEDEMHVYGAKVALVLPSESGGGRSIMARTDTPPSYDNGNENEYFVDKDKIKFVFLDDNKHTMTVVDNADIDWGSDFGAAGTNGNNVTRNGTVKIKTHTRPAYMVVLVNVDDKVENALKNGSIAYDYDTMTKAVDAPSDEGDANGKGVWLKYVAKTEESGFFLMTNSTYVNNDNKPTENNTIKAVSVKDNIVEYDKLNDEENQSKIIEVYVERVVAKATLNINNEAIASHDNTYEVKDKGEEHIFGVKLTGWTLNATNKSFLPLKEIVGIQDAEWNYMKNNFTVNLPGQFRSFWAVDDNYTDGTYGDNTKFESNATYTDWAKNSLDYYTIKEATNVSFNGQTASYCLENTMNVETAKTKAAITHILIAGKYTNSNGSDLAEGEDVYRYLDKIYTKEQLFTYIKEVLEKRNTTSGYKNYDFSSVTKDDFVFETGENTWKDRADVKITGIYYKDEGENNSLACFKKNGGTSDLKTSVFGWTTLWVYPEGVCYYTVPIRHFHKNSDNTKAGYYGMVRNHWYAVTVTLQGFGEPANPDKPVIPDDTEESEYALKAEINVLSWAKNEQNSTVGGDITWD